MDDEFIAESRYCHSSYFCQRDESFDPIGQKRRRRSNVDDMSIGDGEYSFLPLVDMVHLDHLSRHDYHLYVNKTLTISIKLLHDLLIFCQALQIHLIRSIFIVHMKRNMKR